MAESKIKKLFYVKSKTVSGTTDSNGRLPLGLNNGNAVLSIFGNRNNMLIPMLNTSTFEWNAVMVDAQSDGTLKIIPNTSCTATVEYT